MTKFWLFHTRLLSHLLLLFAIAGSAVARDIDYSQAIPLDAESLAEQGIAKRYASVLPALRIYVLKPLALREKVDPERGTYEVIAGNRKHTVFPSPLGGDEYESWGVATVTLFEIVNRQLANAPVKFYAVNSGNDLMGIFLTEQQVSAARKELKHRKDWPYIPKMEPPWFGQYH